MNKNEIYVGIIEIRNGKEYKIDLMYSPEPNIDGYYCPLFVTLFWNQITYEDIENVINIVNEYVSKNFKKVKNEKGVKRELYINIDNTEIYSLETTTNYLLRMNRTDYFD